MKEPFRIEHGVFIRSGRVQLVGEQLVGMWELGEWLLVNDNVSMILHMY